MTIKAAMPNCSAACSNPRTISEAAMNITVDDSIEYQVVSRASAPTR